MCRRFFVPWYPTAFTLYVCFAVYTPLQLPDLMTSWEFREGLYREMGRPAPLKPAMKGVLFWLREPNSGRSFMNTQALIDIVAKHNLSYL